MTMHFMITDKTGLYDINCRMYQGERNDYLEGLKLPPYPSTEANESEHFLNYLHLLLGINRNDVSKLNVFFDRFIR